MARFFRRLHLVFPFLALLAVGGGALGAPIHDVVVVMDNSGSMRQNDPGFLAREAVLEFLREPDPRLQVALLIYDQKVRLPVPLTPLTAEAVPRIASALDSVDYRGQLTDSPEALARAVELLGSDGRPGSQKSIVFLTDGIVDVGDPQRSGEKARWMREELARKAAAANIRFYGVAFTEGADVQLLESIAVITGGGYHRALRAEDIEQSFMDIRKALTASHSPADEPSNVADIAIDALSGEAAASASRLVDDDQAAPRPETSDVDSEVKEQSGAADDGFPSADAGPSGRFGSEEPAGAGVVKTEDSSRREISPTAAVPGPSVLPGNLAQGSGGSSPEPSKVERPVPVQYKAVAETVQESAEQRVDEAAGLPDWAGWASGIAGALVLLAVGLLTGLRVRNRRRRFTSTGGAPRRSTPKVSARFTPEAGLRDLSGVTGLRRLEIPDGTTTLGRSAPDENPYVHHIQILRDTVSRVHATIVCRSGTFWISDNGSRNGTSVNGRRISGQVQLRHRDRITIDEYDFEFLMAGAGGDEPTVLGYATAADGGKTQVMVRPSEDGARDEDSREKTELLRPSAGPGATGPDGGEKTELLKPMPAGGGPEPLDAEKTELLKPSERGESGDIRKDPGGDLPAGDSKDEVQKTELLRWPRDTGPDKEPR